MADVGTKAALTPARKRLVELLQKLRYGRIEGLVIRNGEPVFDPAPRVVRDIKFGGENGPRLQCQFHDFALKEEVIELFEVFDRLGNGTVQRLEVKDGLPFRMTKSVRF